MTPRDAALARWQPRIGTEVGRSNPIIVTQGMMDDFAKTTHDDQWIHLDAERAKATQLGGTIAHGFLTLSLASRFSYDCFPEEPGQTMGINYGFDKIRFLAPVRPNTSLRGQFVLLDVIKRKPNELMRKTRLTIEMEGHDTPALVGEWFGLVLFDAK